MVGVMAKGNVLGRGKGWVVFRVMIVGSVKVSCRDGQGGESSSVNVCVY